MTDVGSIATCVGGYAGIYDMSGNVAEWEDACTSTETNSNCARRGGSFVALGNELACTAALAAPRMSTNDHLGFRCCL